MRSASVVPRAASAAMILFIAGLAHAGVTGSPATSHDLTKIGKARGWAVGSITQPVAVSFDSQSEAWSMDLAARGGRDLRSREGRIYLFQQVITPSGNGEWTGWETKILSPGWEWVTGERRREDPNFSVNSEGDGSATLGDIGGVTRVITPGDSSHGGSLMFEFGGLDPNEAPGASYVIRGYLRYVGTDPDIRRERFRGTIEVESQPVTNTIPNASSTLLFGIAGLAAAKRRRR